MPEPNASVFVYRPRRTEPDSIRQFLSKATRLKLPSGLLALISAPDIRPSCPISLRAKKDSGGGARVFAVIRWPFLIDPTTNAPTTAATFAGALLGAAALFFGSQINEVIRRGDAKTQLQERQRRVRAVLDNEFVRVCANLIQSVEKSKLPRPNSGFQRTTPKSNL